MKEKLANLKEKIISNRKNSIMAAVAVLIVIIIAVSAVAILKNGDRKKTPNSEGVIKNDSASDSKGTSDNSNKKEDKKDGESTSSEDGSDSSSEPVTDENGETIVNAESGTTAANGNSGSSDNKNNGNNANTGNTGGTTGKSNSGNTGNGGNSGTAGGNGGATGGNGGATGGNSGATGGNSGTAGGNGGTSGGNSGSTVSPVTPVTGRDTPQANQNTIYNQLFDINNKVTIKVDISDSELQKIQSDYKRYGSAASTYRIADKVTITIGGTSYEMYEVGIRLKGNSSRVEPLVGGDINQRNLVNFKLSFKQTFDDVSLYGNEAKTWSSDAARSERKNRTFAGLESLELKWNRNFDSTYTCNYWANMMFKDILGYAQSTTLCNLNLGTINYGVYVLYEPVDENFIARYFPNDQGGDLYKCGWGTTGNNNWTGANYTTGSASSIGVSQDNSSKKYAYDLKTNKKKSNYSSIKNLINTVNSNPSAFGNVVDTDRWVKFAATAYFAGNPDDMRNNYNNHYVYFLKNGKAVFIPYDYDRCFGITSGWNVDNGLLDANPASEQAKGKGETQANPLYKYSVIRKNGNNYGNTYSSAYKQQLARIASSKWVNYNEFLKVYNTFRNHYANVAIPSSNVRALVNDNHISGVQSTNKLAFAESGNGNQAVSTYFQRIVAAYNNAG